MQDPSMICQMLQDCFDDEHSAAVISKVGALSHGVMGPAGRRLNCLLRRRMAFGAWLRGSMRGWQVTAEISLRPVLIWFGFLWKERRIWKSLGLQIAGRFLLNSEKGQKTSLISEKTVLIDSRFFAISCGAPYIQ